MTRIRYSNRDGGLRVSKPMLANSNMVVVTDNVVNGAWEVLNFTTKEVLATGTQSNAHLRMKEIKNVLSGMGVMFQQETRQRGVRLTTQTSNEKVA